MPELPKPRRVNIWNARKYIAEVCGLNDYLEVDPAFYDALCNGDLCFQAELNIPESAYRQKAIRRVEAIPTQFWIDWGYSAFASINGALNRSTIKWPNEKGYNPPYYSNPMIAIADIDAWLNNSSNEKVSVSAVPEKVYQERVDKAIKMDVSYNRAEDRAWAIKNRYSVESVDAARIKFAPAKWQKQGRPAAEKESAKETAK